MALLVAIAGITGSEALVFLGQIELALGGYFFILVLCSMAAFWIEPESMVFQALALLPTYRLLNLGMPVFVDLTILWLPLIYGPLILGLVVFLRNRATIQVSLIGDSVDSILLTPAAFLLAMGFAAVELFITHQSALVPIWTINNLIILSVIMIVFVAVGEELLFRGILQRALEDRFGRIAGICLASGLFGVMHSGYGLLSAIGFGAVVGIVLGILYDATDSLLLVIFIHAFMNLFLYALFPYLGPIFAF